MAGLSRHTPLEAPVAKANKLKERGEPAANASGKLPLRHVAIIMDGNRRWASARHLPQLIGHKEGVKTLKTLVKHLCARKLEYLTVYAFSSENWSRAQEEVDYLMQLFTEALTNELSELSGAGVRLSFIGDLANMPADLCRRLDKATEQTAKNEGMRMQVALNYGSRLEIVEAARQLAADVKEGRLKPADISLETFSQALYTRELPDPDLIIRTGGEMRLSNYLLWQAAYAEIYVTQTMWPDFAPELFDDAIADYSQRQRRYGGD